MVDRNLFLHDLAIVAIMKCEGRYIKEWLDYHLLAGVDHFYIYDNDSPDNQAEVVAPYVEAGLVDYIPAPGKAMQIAVYNDAVNRFKFQCRYMAFIDGDEFIYPKTDNRGGIMEVVEEILSKDKNAAGLAIHWHCFGSNNQQKIDYSRGVLERFTHRAPHDWFEVPPRAPCYCGNIHIKTIANPRMTNFIQNAHFANYFEEHYSINENGNIVNGFFNQPILANKIVINHYILKSMEEYKQKAERGYAPGLSKNMYTKDLFDKYDLNDEFDDGILKYRDERAKVFQLPDKSYAATRLLTALAANLSPALLPNIPQDFYAGKMETFLTCRAVAAYLKTKLTDATPAEFYEEAALRAVLKSLSSGASMADARLLISELPNLLTLPYPVVEELRNTCLNIIQQMLDVMRLNKSWLYYVELDYIQRLLKNFRE